MPAKDEIQRFSTADLRLAAIARAAGGRLIDVNDSDPSRISFAFDGVPENFERAVFNGQVQVDAGAVLAALEQVYGFVTSRRRAGPLKTYGSR